MATKNKKTFHSLFSPKIGRLTNRSVIYKYDKVDSTSLEARRYGKYVDNPLENIVNNGIVFLGFEQTSGMGQFERRWESKPGGLYYTLLIHYPDIKPENVKERVFGVGNLVSELLSKLTGLPIVPRHPNDLYIQRKKVGGILLEILPPDEKALFSIGIGINFNQETFESQDVINATSIFQQLGKKLKMRPFVEQLTQQLVNAVQTNTWNSSPPAT